MLGLVGGDLFFWRRDGQMSPNISLCRVVFCLIVRFDYWLPCCTWELQRHCLETCVHTLYHHISSYNFINDISYNYRIILLYMHVRVMYMLLRAVTAMLWGNNCMNPFQLDGHWKNICFLCMWIVKTTGYLPYYLKYEKTYAWLKLIIGSSIDLDGKVR